MQIKKNIPMRYIPLAIVGVLIVLLLIGIFVIPSPIKNHGGSAVKPGPLPKEETVILKNDGFLPETITIEKDSAIRWINKRGTDASVNSDDYPTNKLFPELNLGKFSNNMSIAHVFTKSGTYRYHDHLHPDFHGTVIVK